MTWRRIAACILETILIIGAFYVSGKQGSESDAYRYASQIQHQATLSLVSEPTPNQQTQSTESKPPQWYASVQWSNWALVIIGAITFYAIWIQARETRKSADATKKSVELQEVLNRQWIDVDNIETSHIVRYGIGGQENSVKIEFSLVNNTKMPLRIRAVRFQIGKDHGISMTMQHVLAPESLYPFEYLMALKDFELELYRKLTLVLVVTGRVGYIDAFEKQREEPFGFTCICGAPRYTEVRPHPGLPSKEQQEEAN